MLVLAVYAFMLRVPSEALPATLVSPAQLSELKESGPPVDRKHRHPLICVHSVHVEWFFWTRKNRPKPSSIFRAWDRSTSLP